MKMEKNRISGKIFGTIALGVLLPGAVFAAEDKRPNLLLMMSDDLTYTDMGFQGNSQVKTPYLDELANSGMRFKYCYNSSPMCAPTRMSLYTGIAPVRNGGYPNHSRVYDNIKSMPHYLRDMGYDVALTGKKHYAPEKNFPFDYLGGRGHDGGKGKDLDIEKAAKYISDHTGSPWCLVVMSNQPHSPWNRGDKSQYKAKDLKLPPYMVDSEDTREALTRYYAEITYMDNQMGEVLQALKESGQEENTLVVFLSEQGSSFPHCKWTCYDTGLRSAGVVRWPAVVKGHKESDAMIQYIDVLPTFIEAAGGDPSKLGLDGKSFLPVLKGEKTEHRKYICGVQTSKGIYSGTKTGYGIRTVRDDKYRLIWNLNWDVKFQNVVTEGFKPFKTWGKMGKAGDEFAKVQYERYLRRPEFELYDMDNDPYEMDNLVDNPKLAKVKARLKAELDKWMVQQGDKGKETESLALTRMAAGR